MSGSIQHKWERWLRDGRFTEDQHSASTWEQLHSWRDGILERARLDGDDVLLDVGTGEGMIGFGALDQLGSTGRVIFSDISAPLLGRCRTMAHDLEETDRCAFVQCPAETLPLDDGSVDVITTRSVLIYVHDKERALSEFHRVLAPGGRISVFEPINSFTEIMRQRPNVYAGYDLSGCAALADKVHTAWMELYEPSQNDLSMDFDARELFSLVEGAGFEEVELDLSAWHTVHQSGRAEDWEAVIESSPNPYAPTLREAMDAGLTDEERDRFVDHLKPMVESGSTPKVDKGAIAFISAAK